MIPLDPCPTEDSANCFWDATVHGNGMGQSFFEYDGITTSVYLPKGFHIESVQVDPEHFYEPGYAGGAGYGVTFAQNETAAPNPEPSPTAEVTTTTPAPTADPFDLAGTGLNMAPLEILLAAAITVCLIGLALIGWHEHKTKKESKR